LWSFGLKWELEIEKSSGYLDITWGLQILDEKMQGEGTYVNFELKFFSKYI
jgi:hypothetical protein